MLWTHANISSTKNRPPPCRGGGGNFGDVGVGFRRELLAGGVGNHRWAGLVMLPRGYYAFRRRTLDVLKTHANFH